MQFDQREKKFFGINVPIHNPDFAKIIISFCMGGFLLLAISLTCVEIAKSSILTWGGMASYLLISLAAYFGKRYEVIAGLTYAIIFLAGISVFFLIALSISQKIFCPFCIISWCINLFLSFAALVRLIFYNRPIIL